MILSNSIILMVFAVIESEGTFKSIIVLQENFDSPRWQFHIGPLIVFVKVFFQK